MRLVIKRRHVSDNTIDHHLRSAGSSGLTARGLAKTLKLDPADVSKALARFRNARRRLVSCEWVPVSDKKDHALQQGCYRYVDRPNPSTDPDDRGTPVQTSTRERRLVIRAVKRKT